VRSQVISEISLAGTNYSVTLSRTFDFRAIGNPFSPTISVAISGEQDSCRSLISYIEERLSAKRKWYSALIPSNSFGFITATSLIMLILFTKLLIIAKFNKAFSENYLYNAFFLIPAMLFILNWFRSLLFPQLLVNIGRSGEIASRAQGLRTFLFYGVLLTLAEH
jgi:hypothetical protein